jgi:subtilisin family serine protease
MLRIHTLHRLIRWLARAAVLLALLVPGTGPARAGEPAADFVPGRLLVKFTGTAAGPAALASLGLQSAGELPALDVHVLAVAPGQELATAATLRARGDVVYAEPDYRVHALDTVPNDPNLGFQWGLARVHAFKAWDILSTTGGAGIIVAVVDTGVDLTHPDFACAGKLLPGTCFVEDGCSPQDDDSRGHGTHVAGIAGACTNNAVGVAGMAWAVRLMPVKVLDAVGSGSHSNLARGMIYAVDNGARIINLSLGGTADSVTMSNAVNYAVNHGVLVIAAAGNCAGGGTGCGGMVNPIMYPAAYPNVLAVAATDHSDEHAYFSEYHDYVDVSAPGVGITSTIIGGYGSLSGTSMATPFASGLAALAWSADRSLSAAQVRSLLEANADDLGTPGKDIYFGYGRLNAWRTLQAQVGLRAAPTAALFLVDTDDGPLPARQTITLSTASRQAITWTAAISPATSWLHIVPPASGQVSSAGSAQLALTATRPVTYGTYQTTLVVGGVAGSGAQAVPATVKVTLRYLPHLYQMRLFPVLKDAPLP